jgi:signal transduction histidine kinase/CheY-like chemotaxis protein/ligand-binding sensor domain-containing protein
MKLKHFVTILFLGISLVSFSQTHTLRFDHLSVEQGLSQANVTDIYQDNLGFIWVATEDGLNLYDGYTFTVFRNDEDDSTSLSNNNVRSIVEDARGDIWLATQFGLNRYNRALNKFERFFSKANDQYSLSNNDVEVVFIDSKNILWAGTLSGLNEYDAKHNTFKRYLPDPTNSNSVPNGIIRSIVETSTHDLWIGTISGLSKLSADRKLFTNYRLDLNDPRSLQSNNVTTLNLEHDNRLWVGTNDRGLALMNVPEGTFTHFEPELNDSTSLLSTYVRHVNRDDTGRLWVACNGGLSVMVDKGKFLNFKHTSEIGSLSASDVVKIFFDHNQRMWVGTRFGGINIFDNRNHNFNSNTKNEKNVTSFAEDENGNLWIATDGDGLSYYDRSTRKFSTLVHHPNNKNSLANNKVLSLRFDYTGMLWIGYWNGGVDCYNRKTKTFKHYLKKPDDPRSISDNNIFYIFEDSKKNLWIATWGNGLNKYNRGTDDFTQYTTNTGKPNSLSTADIVHIAEDHLGKLWIATELGGIEMFDPETEKFVQFKVTGKKGDISGNAAYVVYEDSKKNLWIGTGAGLNVMDRKSGMFKAYRKKDGLPNESIVGILEDNDHNLWLSTYYGLSKFDPVNQSFKNYTLTDGIQSNQYGKWAFFKLATGELVFGGINGFDLFNPKDIQDNPYKPPVYITDFSLFNKPIGVGKDEILKQNIILTKEITLDHTQNFFSFEFAALNYLHAERNQYRYIMEGFQREWIEAGVERKASYTNLSPGKYVFKVMASNNDGVWSDKVCTIDITIVPPIWKTWWFVTLSIVVFIGGVFVLYYVRLRGIEVQRKALEEQVELRTQEVLAQKEMVESQTENMQTLNEQLQAQTDFLQTMNDELQQQKEEIIIRQEEAEKARHEAEQANRAKSIFLATMSHEIRTPMNGVIGMASLLSETPLNDEQHEYTETIKSCGESLLIVINDILDYSKIESGKMELEEKEFDLRTCIEEVLDVFAGKASQSGLDLVYEIDYDVPIQIIGDGLRLRQVIMNLVGNAIKFTHVGEVFVGVHLVKSRGDDVDLAFEIRDTGIGIPEDKIDRLFKAFSQVDSSTTRKYGGTGLGLVICEKLVGLMGGAITVTSASGQGTTFTFTVQTQVSRESSRKYVYRTMVGVEGKKVLVIDDNYTNRIILKNQLERWKLVPVLASSAEEALAILSQDPAFDLVLTDMQMPQMDGIQFASLIREKNANTPVILLSSVGDDRSKTHAQLFSSVLTKPVRQGTLHKHIIMQLKQQGKPVVAEGESVRKLSADFSVQYPLRILITEDNPVNQKLAERVLTKLGYKPDQALNGQEALDALDAHPYDIILMDVQMPVMDGLEATRQIRSRKGVQPFIIAMTANAMQGDREICLEAGMDEYISKPVKLEDLIGLIEKVAKQNLQA